MTHSRYFDILRYWRNSLADADRMNFANNLPKYAETNLAILLSGQISIGQTETLIDVHAQSHPPKPDEIVDDIPVVICPLIIRPKERSGVSPWKYKDMVPLWIPAKLNTKGRLFIDAEVPPPWIPRDFLEPNDKDGSAIGTVDNLDRYCTLNRESRGTTWSESYHYSDGMLKAVTGSCVEAFALSLDDVEYIPLAQAYVLPQAILVGMSAGIIFLYDTLLKYHQRAPLLEQFAQDEDRETRPLLTSLEQLEAGKHHLGQMNNKFGLSPSQRASLAHFFTKGTGGILAVNGPPGTGKTTLLQSVVASLWVKAALADDGLSPIIVAASTNNQAVTNVIKDFGEVAGADVLSGRWLPQISSYGLYCASKEKSRGTPFLTLDDFPSSVENFEYLAAAMAVFKRNYSKWAHAAFPGLAESILEMRKVLKSMTSAMHHGIDLQINLQREKAKLNQLYGPEGVDTFISKNVRDLESTDIAKSRLVHLQKEWDAFCDQEPWWMTIFLLLPAVKRRRSRRNEAFFKAKNIRRSMKFAEPESISIDLDNGIIAAEEELQQIADRLQRARLDKSSYEHACSVLQEWGEKNGIEIELDRFNDSLDTQIRHQAFCLAAHIWEGRWLLETSDYLDKLAQNTKYQVSEIDRWRRYTKLTPCLVSTFHKLPYLFYKRGPLWGGIDLLIVDEAGQVSPEVAAASLAFAQKALIVGDVLQIEPVWSVPESIDYSNMRRYSIATTEQEIRDFNNSGRAASSGSVMRIAQRQSAYVIEGQFRGMMLTEHRRCVPEIIGFCNELAYNGLLLPKRSSISGHILPHWSYVDVSGKSEQVGSSLVNRREAAAIANWIVQNRKKLEEHYGAGTSVSRISELVAVVTPFAAQANVIRKALADAGVENVKAGTIHVLQGAERPVVIFSPVYSRSDKDKTFFFDRKLNLLNVAVSRAKDSFIVIGDVEVFRTAKKNTFTAVLAKYLLGAGNDISSTLSREVSDSEDSNPDS